MTRTVDWALPAAEAFAAEQPVSSAVGAALAASCNAAYEAIYNVQVPGNVAATIAGHGHTGTLAGGDPDGVAIPRQVLAWTGPIPEWTIGGAASPVAYDYGDALNYTTVGSDGVTTISALVSGRRSVVAGTCGDVSHMVLLGEWRVHLRAGCNGVKVYVWTGFDDDGENMKLYTEVRSLPTGAPIDTAEHEFVTGADYNAAWMELPSVADPGALSAGALLWLQAAGAQITADGDYYIRVVAQPSGGIAQKGTIYLFGVNAYEVIP